ncbi:chemotaxis protein CheW [Dulcicalothrix desertica PCC 7102]|uniref:Chemotaxis protein CheW n=1 Tax=Dulcicalothrix desertica PCC 7102 TaxID=232991 RepID=A0A433V4Q2_9CYAN|nr:chemotaxis protein CheW [Dulcicalothrix desertica]RUT01068.1 chemotaxis protein CheW [Dulcicalothrix desertica PCC 7102]TWH39158.1 purine-binding chemotaxis protein CheW [Dulcicalothrix desertica PCC 7102]
MNQQFCTFFLDKIYFGIDVLQVQEVIRFTQITPVPLAPPDILGLINLRGKIVTIIDIKSRLQMNQNIKNPENNYKIILNNKSELISLIVDDIGDVVEVAENQFEPPPATLKVKIRSLLQGAYKLQDKFLLILNVDKLLAQNIE